jgi:50S ribosomal protein L16 3-hydroxylase
MLEPGDMLYLPPGVPHDGIAFGGPCLTLSVGMRAPSQAELTGDLADYLAERLPDELRYTDADLAPAKSAGEIDRPALARLRESLPFAAALDDATLTDWFGRFITRYRSAQAPVPPEKEITEAALRKQLEGGSRLLRHPWARMAWARGKRGATLFVNGHPYPVSADLAERLCATREFEPGKSVPEAELSVLLALVNDGHLIVHKPRRR